MTGQEVEAEEAEQPRIKFTFPVLAVRTQMFNRVFDWLGSLRSSRVIAWVALIIVPIVGGIGLYLILKNLIDLLWMPLVREVVRDLGPGVYLLVPGLNPFLPILYGWLALICAIVVHEGAHGIIARSRGLRVKSSGLFFLFIIPFGAFVDVDEKQLAKAKAKDSLRVLAAGVGGNIVVAIVCILGVMVIVSGLTPVIDGVYVYEVTEGMPALEAGLLAEDVFVTVDNVEIGSREELAAFLESKNLGDVVQVVVARGEKWEDRFSTSVNLTENEEGQTVMGVTVGDLTIEERLRYYQAVTPETLYLYLAPPAFVPGFAPFSDSLAPFYTHGLGAQWQVLANALFWVWFVNVNVAVLNALPIYPLDGGRMFDISLKSILGRRVGEKNVSRITIAVTVALVWVLLMSAVIPFIL
ncbi:MAG: site-2 protease family protein [Candidatus Bathyarchaeum sp.]|nr:MAG: site-2 protease family protein [Candidatus Bathyarchaeum sp.]